MSYFKILLITLLSMMFCFAGPAFSQNSSGTKKKGGRPPAAVAVSFVKKGVFRNNITLIGSLVSPRVSMISSEVDGLIHEVYVSEGDRVKRGDPLVKLVNSRTRILLEEAKSNVREAQNRVKELKTNLKKSENDYELNQKLFKEKIVDKHLLTNSRLSVEAVHESIAQAEFNIESKKARIALYKDNIKKFKIKAPFSGVVTKKLIEKGEWINEGKEVIRIVETDPLWVEAPAPENIVGHIIKGIEATVFIKAAPDTPFIAKVFNVIPEADIRSRTFPVRLLIDNPRGILMVGMTATVNLPYGEMKELLMIPQDAITIKKGKKIVFSIDENDTVKMTPIETGEKRKGWVEVLSGGLKQNDMVVTRGGERLRPGQKIKIVK